MVPPLITDPTTKQCSLIIPFIVCIDTTIIKGLMILNARPINSLFVNLAVVKVMPPWYWLNQTIITRNWFLHLKSSLIYSIINHLPHTVCPQVQFNFAPYGFSLIWWHIQNPNGSMESVRLWIYFSACHARILPQLVWVIWGQSLTISK